MQEAMLWSRERNGIRCELCARKCFIPKDKRGFCLIRINKDNKLYTLNYGKLVSVNIDPIEKKPLFHFYPGSKSLSIASAGCNFRCTFCCNAELSQVLTVEQTGKIPGEDYSPEDIVRLAEKNNCKSISYTYTEPTMFFEFAYKVAKFAHRSNIMNVFVTNGYITEEALKKMKYLDAATVDFKASADPEFYQKFMSVPDVNPIFDALKQMKKQRIFTEITNLIVPQVGDNLELSKKLAEWVNAELGSEVPFHVLRFHPNHKLLELPETPISTLEKVIDEIRRAGLRYVYIGNVPGNPYENTYCYNCQEPLILREGVSVKKNNMTKDRCPNCGLRMNIITE